MSSVAATRRALVKDLESKQAALSQLNEELKSATPSDKNQLLWLINRESSALKGAQENLRQFENPIILPHLVLTKISVRFHPDKQHFDATLWVNNNSILPSLGAFDLALSVTYDTYDQDPPLHRTDVRQITTPDSTDVQPGGTNPFVFANFPFVTKPGSASALYTFDALLFAGPDGVVGDNTLHVVLLLKPPLIVPPIVEPPIATP